MALQTIAKLVPTAKILRVQLTVRNNSSQYEIFQQMTCSWQQNWRCSRSDIFLPLPSCTRNFLETIILPPWQSYQQKVWPLMFWKVKPSKAIFRFGLVRNRHDFTSEEIQRIYESSEKYGYFSRVDALSRFKREQDTFWSNAVSVVIRKEWMTR